MFNRMPGGARRDRTDDLKLAKLPLSQLSYGPLGGDMVGLGRLELPTSRLSSARSNQLSYKPDQTIGPHIHGIIRTKKRSEDGDVPPNAIFDKIAVFLKRGDRDAQASLKLHP